MTRRTGVKSRYVVSIVALTAAMALAACGNGESGGSKDSDSMDVKRVGITTRQGGEKEAAAVKAAEALDLEKADLPEVTIGALNVTGTAESMQRAETALQQAADKLGWKVILIDAKGDPQAMARGLTSLLNQGADVILSMSNQPSAIQQGLRTADQKGIPVINVGGFQTPDPLINADYSGDEAGHYKALDAYILDHLANDAEIGISVDTSNLSVKQRTDQLEADLKGTDIKVVDRHPIDWTNLTEDAQRAARTALQAHPGIDAFVGTTDSTLVATGQVLRSQNKCDEIQNYTVYGNLVNLEEIRKGCATAIVESPIEADVWAALDQFAQIEAGLIEIADLPKNWSDLDNLYKFPMRTGTSIQVIDKSNLPPAGEVVPPTNDFISFFETKWHEQFGTDVD